MVKILIAFVVVAGACLYLLTKGGGEVSMAGESHSTESHAPAGQSNNANKSLIEGSRGLHPPAQRVEYRFTKNGRSLLYGRFSPQVFRQTLA
jgi:hypothetical protein